MDKAERAKIRRWIKSVNEWEMPEEFVGHVSTFGNDKRDQFRVMYEIFLRLEKALTGKGH